jgi:NAD(P)H dehydrogenase (quinone)
VATSFTSATNLHGGQESTLLALNNTFYHWGSLIVPPGYTHPALYAAGGDPYGTSYTSGIEGDSAVSTDALTAARYQGHRLAHYASRLVRGSATSAERGDPAQRSQTVLAPAPYDPPSYYRNDHVTPTDRSAQ